MCLSKYSNLEHLREVAINLYSTKDHEDINGLCERELAALIHTFYQVRIYLSHLIFYIHLIKTEL